MLLTCWREKSKGDLRNMLNGNSQQLPLSSTQKVCSHCGRDFDAFDREYTSPCEAKIVPELSVRERQVADLIQQAKSNKEIAYELGLTIGTVKEYLFHIFRKLGVSNRTELALWKRQRSESEISRMNSRVCGSSAAAMVSSASQP